MKHFITAIPLQPKDKLNALRYENKENAKGLDSDFETEFPIIIPLANTVSNEEEIRITALVTDDPDKHAAVNFETFKERLKALAAEKGFIYTLNTISVSYDESSEKQMNLFENLITSFKHGDRITADVTYGNKPSPMVLLMALSYAYQFCEDTVVDMVVYGARNFGKSGGGFIFDESSLFYMNSIMTRMSAARPADPLSFIKAIIGM